MPSPYVCTQCNEEIVSSNVSVAGTGYGWYNEAMVCYDCCAKIDKEHMRTNGRIVLYLSNRKNYPLNVSNWPGSLKFNVIASRESKTNWCLTRTDVWFMFDGNVWWGYHVGHNSDLVHCRRTKRTRL